MTESDTRRTSSKPSDPGPSRPGTQPKTDLTLPELKKQLDLLVDSYLMVDTGIHVSQFLTRRASIIDQINEIEHERSTRTKENYRKSGQ